VRLGSFALTSNPPRNTLTTKPRFPRLARAMETNQQVPCRRLPPYSKRCCSGKPTDNQRKRRGVAVH
jgi:hypothetical protein